MPCSHLNVGDTRPRSSGCNNPHYKKHTYYGRITKNSFIAK